MRWKLNVLAMGDEEARSLGVETERLKGLVIICTTLITAAAVSVCGMVSWVGLVIPHVGRMLVGPDHRLLLPATLSIGASYLLFIDDIARTASHTVENRLDPGLHRIPLAEIVLQQVGNDGARGQFAHRAGFQMAAFFGEAARDDTVWRDLARQLWFGCA